MCTGEKRWDVDLLKDLFVQRDVDIIQGVPLSFRDVSDRVCWRWENSGQFSVRSCYRAIIGEITSSEWLGWTEMWRWKLPPKVKQFFWQACRSLLPTKDNLMSRRINCSDVCGLCGMEAESQLHLFIFCPQTKEAWDSVGWSWVEPGAGSFLEQIRREFQVKNIENLCKLIWGCWGLWGERNNRVWGGASNDLKHVMRKARVYVEGWHLAQKGAGGQTNIRGGGISGW
ncbi:unnamed protein product [Cuscuta epithymum]|uniref:Reverse transcriptase zinc-binding domain-containing protein n=1 Tax=Cuscuta epithymum TaxID=186058 RepID=A0AAV0CRX6_9ASTE|nr:unnamed protein product [Cuscuta epithymum]